MKKQILIFESSGLNQDKIKFLIKKFKNIKFIKTNDKFLTKGLELRNINAVINIPRHHFNKNLLSQMTELEWIHSGGAGIERFLIPELVNSKIELTNGKIIQGPEVSEHAIGLLLSISRNIKFSYNSINKQKLKRPIELRNKKCLIFGLGGIGILIAEKLKSFGMYIVGVSNEMTPLLSFVDEKYETNNFLKKLRSMDVVICSAPLTFKTKNFFNKNIFNKMKKDSIFINISRGELVNTDHLVNFLKKDKFFGVGLDVSNPEPLQKNHYLRKKDNVVLTPHIAGPSDKNRERSFQLILKNIQLYEAKEKLLNIVDKKLGF